MRPTYNCRPPGGAGAVTPASQERIQQTRLAILAEAASTSQPADLLAVLSREPQIELLDRLEIQKTFREQQLSVLGQDYIKLGRLAGADGLVVLELVSDGKGQQLQARVVAVKPVVILGSVRASWPLTNAMDWSSKNNGGRISIIDSCC